MQIKEAVKPAADKKTNFRGGWSTKEIVITAWYTQKYQLAKVQKDRACQVWYWR
jgi:hypothetical protein